MVKFNVLLNWKINLNLLDRIDILIKAVLYLKYGSEAPRSQGIKILK
jgi:hypothetical protein